MRNELYNRKHMNNTTLNKFRGLVYLMLLQTPQISIDITLDAALKCESHCATNVQINYYEGSKF